MAANASVPEPYTSTGLDGSGGLRRIERSETLTGSDRTAASSLKALRNFEQLALVGAETFRVRPSRPRAVAEVDGHGQIAVGEVAAPRVAPLGAGLAERLDPAGRAPQPWVEHDPAAVVEPARHGLVPEDVRERDERGEWVVPRAVQEYLLGIGAAQAADHGLAFHPAGGRRDGLGHLLQADGGVPRDEHALVHPAADRRRGLPRQVVLEHERLHLTP